MDTIKMFIGGVVVGLVIGLVIGSLIAAVCMQKEKNNAKD